MHTLGWSFGDIAHWHDGRRVWQVFAYRANERIIVNARTQARAWDEALRQAGIAQRS
jgi:hypothetical protein